MAMTFFLHLLLQFFRVSRLLWFQVIKRSLVLFHNIYDYEEGGRRPSPSLVPVPYMRGSCVVPNFIKQKLPVMEFRRYSGFRGDGHQADAVCAICLGCINGSEEIRELGNCNHVYHRECLDKWMDQGNGTCPLCRLELLPADLNEGQDLKDPWRMERMAYLFGEDCLFHTF
ncbi:hypothetical protein SLEP1_g2184 [Rubroshorea leprosula]|uniref:RING-type domain-containing protein n=1 Tax=Rubroshorea leprosula TaxID=152421 RepID=A0AAV5HKR5_9ROSI|nr:hypothetical protein SLEP1_g2184 [Rubroshorea leprosula]